MTARRTFRRQAVTVTTNRGPIDVPGLVLGPLAITPETIGRLPDGQPVLDRGSRNVTHLATGRRFPSPPGNVWGLDPDGLSAHRLWVACLVDAAPDPEFWARQREEATAAEMAERKAVLNAARDDYRAAVADIVRGEAA